MSRINFRTLPLNPNISYNFVLKCDLDINTYLLNPNCPVDLIKKSNIRSKNYFIINNNNLTLKDLMSDTFIPLNYYQILPELEPSKIDYLMRGGLGSVNYLSSNPNIFEIYLPFDGGKNAYAFPYEFIVSYSYAYVLLRNVLNKDVSNLIFNYL